MNTNNDSGRDSRAQLAQWWAGARPLLRRTVPRCGVCAAILLLLWMTAAAFSARHVTLKPKFDLPTIDLHEYVKRGRDIPEADNAAAAYAKIEKRLTKGEDRQKINSQRDLARTNPEKLSPQDWQRLVAYCRETDDAAADVRRAARLPKCVLMFNESRGWYSCDWQGRIVGLIRLRAQVAASVGDGPAWRQGMDDLMALAESLSSERTPMGVGLEDEALDGMLRALERACRAGIAGDDAWLTALDARLAALRPMEAFEPLLALACATMDFQHAYGYGVTYPCYFTREMLEHRSYLPEYMDIPLRAGGFAARDRMLVGQYVSELLSAIRSSQPQSWERAWALMSAKCPDTESMGGALAPRYSDLCRRTISTGYGGTPGTLYAITGRIRMTRAIIAVVRHGRDAQGQFRDADFLKNLLREFPNPMTGTPIVLHTVVNRFGLSYYVSYNPHGRWTTSRWRDRWELKAWITAPPDGKGR